MQTGVLLSFFRPKPDTKTGPIFAAFITNLSIASGVSDVSISRRKQPVYPPKSLSHYTFDTNITQPDSDLNYPRKKATNEWSCVKLNPTHVGRARFVPNRDPRPVVVFVLYYFRDIMYSRIFSSMR